MNAGGIIGEIERVIIIPGTEYHRHCPRDRKSNIILGIEYQRHCPRDRRVISYYGLNTIWAVWEIERVIIILGTECQRHCPREWRNRAASTRQHQASVLAGRNRFRWRGRFPAVWTNLQHMAIWVISKKKEKNKTTTTTTEKKKKKNRAAVSHSGSLNYE